MLDKSEMIFGVRAVIEAIQAGKEIDKILVKKDKKTKKVVSDNLSVYYSG